METEAHVGIYKPTFERSEQILEKFLDEKYNVNAIKNWQFEYISMDRFAHLYTNKKNWLPRKGNFDICIRLSSTLKFLFHKTSHLVNHVKNK